jgi:hypothetical protein
VTNIQIEPAKNKEPAQSPPTAPEQQKDFDDADEDEDKDKKLNETINFFHNLNDAKDIKLKKKEAHESEEQEDTK